MKTDETVNEDVSGAVREDVYDAVYEAVYEAVGDAVYEDVDWILYEAVYWNVYDAVSGAVRNDPPHTALNNFLTSNQEAPGIRSGGAMNTNKIVDLAVYRDVYDAVDRSVFRVVNRAMYQAVGKDVFWDVYWTLDDAVAGTMHGAMVNVAHTDPPHPSLQGFLEDLQ